MPIEVRDADFWGLSEPVTVQIFDDEGNLDECNHAGAEEDSDSFDIININGQDSTHYFKYLKCDKANCGAVKYLGDDRTSWEYPNDWGTER